MQKIILICSGILFITLSYAQENFKWDAIDSVSKTKSQIYSDSKMFIAKAWKSAQDVIQNDDKDAGNILVKGSSIQKVKHALNVFTYVYSYSVTFKMKDNKYRMILDNVFCESAYPVGPAQYDILKIEPFNGQYIKGKTGFSASTLPEKKAVVMMANLQAELQSLVDSFKEYIKTQSSDNDDW